MVEQERMNMQPAMQVSFNFKITDDIFLQHINSEQLRICVCVKKRPIFQKELSTGEVDCVSCTNPTITVHECKYRVDGITKFIDNQEFMFDNAFAEEESNEDLYH